MVTVPSAVLSVRYQAGPWASSGTMAAQPVVHWSVWTGLRPPGDTSTAFTAPVCWLYSSAVPGARRRGGSVAGPGQPVGAVGVDPSRELGAVQGLPAGGLQA